MKLIIEKEPMGNLFQAHIDGEPGYQVGRSIQCTIGTFVFMNQDRFKDLEIEVKE